MCDARTRLRLACMCMKDSTWKMQCRSETYSTASGSMQKKGRILQYRPVDMPHLDDAIQASVLAASCRSGRCLSFLSRSAPAVYHEAVHGLLKQHAAQRDEVVGH